MLLTTKLTLPAPPPHTVHRQRLYQTLDQGWQLGQRLLLIAAPAGYGKTSLLAGWLAERKIPSAWLSLDSRDNDPARFLTYLSAALQPYLPDLSETVLPALNAPRPPEWASLAASLLNTAAGLAQPVCLVLDDVHLLSAPAITDLLRALIEGLPANLRIALLTRADPALPLARLRARQQMVEVRERDLRFTLEEAECWLCEKMGLPLQCGHLATLQTRTEGWAVGLQLAALSFRQSPDPESFLQAFSGTHRYVIDYLLEEVLSGLEPQLRRFLCESAVLERLCAPLCAAVLEDTPAAADHPDTNATYQATLEQLERQNLFLLPLDDQRRWYRYHHLLAELLRSEIPPERQAVLQRRAAIWLAAHQQPAEAVGYALAAAGNTSAGAGAPLAADGNVPADGDYALAAGLIRQAALPAVESGQLVTAIGWLAALPEASLLAQPDLATYYGWFLLYNGQIKEAGAWLERLQAALPDITRLPAIQQALLVGLSAWQRMAAGDGFDFAAFQRAQELLDSASEIGPSRPDLLAAGDRAATDRYFRPLLLLALGQAALAAGDTPRARRYYQTGLELAEASNSQITALVLQNNLAFLLATCGERQTALVMCQEAFQRYCAADGHPTLLAGIPAIPLGVIEYKTGDLVNAYTHLTLGLSLTRRLGMYDVLANPANQCLAFLLAEQGQTEQAFQLLEQVERQSARIGLRVVVASLRNARAELALHQGQLGIAEGWAAECGLPAVDPGNPQAAAAFASRLPAYDRVPLLLARLWNAQGYPQAALALLARLEALNRAAGWRSDLVDVLVVQTQAWLQAGDQGQARQALAEALDLAARQEYRQPFRWALTASTAPGTAALGTAALGTAALGTAAPGPSLAGLLHDLAGQHPDFVASLPLAAPAPEGPRLEPGSLPGSQPGPHPTQPAVQPAPARGGTPGLQAIIDPPGEREREILRLVASGLSNQEIADRLYLTTGTVKWYLNQTYRKLGVNSRTQAVALARQIGIV